MSGAGAFLRNSYEVYKAEKYFEDELKTFYDNYRVENVRALTEALINRDVVITSITYLSAILDYIEHGGKSRGSYLINGSSDIDSEHFDKVQYTSFDGEGAHSRFEERRPIPSGEQWFETVYNKFGK